MPKRASSAPGAASTRRTADSNTYRFFVSPAAIDGAAVVLTDAALVHQLAVVLRLVPEQIITLLDNCGRAYVVRLDQVDKRAVRGTVIAEGPAHGEPRLRLTLYMALIRPERFEWVLQKGTELGITTFVPMHCEHSRIGDAGSVNAARLERWERIIREAAEQCRRGMIPMLQPPQPFATACRDLVAPAEAVLLWEKDGAPSLRAHLASGQIPSALFSGPEGGWSEEERDIALARGITLASLGPRTLRAETAPLVATTAVLFTGGDLD